MPIRAAPAAEADSTHRLTAFDTSNIHVARINKTNNVLPARRSSLFCSLQDSKMTVYSFYIFDRHAECIYKRRWLPRPTSISGKVSDIQNPNNIVAAAGQSPRSADDDAKLIFGTVFSLRNMARKLGGEDDSFICYRTSQYQLHFYETPTNIKFVMLTDTKSPSMRIALQQIYVNLYVEYANAAVVKNPLSPVEHPGGIGVDNELFEESLEQFVTRVLS
ncbi:hypothetical protein UA08_02772 [Talaromyces atroroseus]|uniref:Trafficking protein particle complex subunit n=1 Tax=Talaromyces atroroseus TaxID=1441469 RepID=A0A225ALA0_TALAT|nr:hypothetical protein UA08_02772 [Talaromyces atroroseus]OKL61670.1 hypothetical protein UA08_02772 [Talaromyces atroroseus]